MPVVRVEDVALREDRPRWSAGGSWPGATLPLHAVDLEEAFTVMSGEGRSQIEGADALLAVGDALLIPTRAKHQLTDPSQSDDLVFASLFPPDTLIKHPVSSAPDTGG